MMRRTPLKLDETSMVVLSAQGVNQLLSLAEQKPDAFVAAREAAAAGRKHLHPRINPGARIFRWFELSFRHGGISRWVTDLARNVAASDGDFPAPVVLLNSVRHATPSQVVVNIITQHIIFVDSFLLWNKGVAQ
ncbi:hypothetical protein [Duganella callida]|uniref:Uncharacterized protein n=1 Tax=Duganella callida TaxID=2561932 RepID=A0A4Y9S874_9BURK|nr:hypothetical protein [Duganella callida]TFW15943.1 hypothetical protein E4L98_24930 [Duganella callida]